MVDKHTVPCIAEKITGPEDISIEMVTWSCACAKSVIISSVLITVRSVSLTLTLEGSIAELNNDRLQDVLATYVPYSPRKTTSPRIPRSALMLVVARVPGLQVCRSHSHARLIESNRRFHGGLGGIPQVRICFAGQRSEREARGVLLQVSRA